MKKLKLRKHESFSLREGWMEKGINALDKSGIKALHVENGIKILGIGSNMVKSLKYWLIATNIIKDGIKGEFTEFGKCVVEYDRYLEADLSWWFVHYFLVTNFESSPVFYYLFNVYSNKHINKERLLDVINEYFIKNDYEFNINFIADDINIFIKSYLKEDIVNNPEDNFLCPLSKLNLLEKDIKNFEFIKKVPKVESLHYLIVYFSLQNIYKDSFDLSDVYNVEKSPCKVFNLDKGLFLQYISIMKNKGLITLNNTAGLNTVYLNKVLTIEDIYNEYLKGE